MGTKAWMNFPDWQHLAHIATHTWWKKEALSMQFHWERTTRN